MVRTPMSAVSSFQLAELADSLGLDVGSHGKKSGNADFSRSETTHLLRIVDVLDQAQRLFGDRCRGMQWIKHQNRALNFKTPLTQLKTSAGTKRVLALLHRMEAGRFA
jgi:putative toxin-antitoxin system antitoxin component (TIGR02293 family)